MIYEQYFEKLYALGYSSPELACARYEGMHDIYSYKSTRCFSVGYKNYHTLDRSVWNVKPDVGNKWRRQNRKCL